MLGPVVEEDEIPAVCAHVLLFERLLHGGGVWMRVCYAPSERAEDERNGLDDTDVNGWMMEDDQPDEEEEEEEQKAGATQ